ncbi:MAG: cytochrome c [Rhodothermales bacterium]
MKISKYLPILVVLLLLSFVSTAFVFETKQPVHPESGAAVAEADLVLDGEEIYMTRCLSCHMAEGQGVPGVFPPLASSEYVAGDKGRVIRMILNGLSGEITVNGVTYNGMMPPWGGFLNDQQVAEVLTYVRSSFGNEADAVTEQEVARVRAKVADRKETWTVEELNKEENLGIPEGD